VERSPEDAEAWYALGRAREGSGRMAKAGEAHARAMELFLRQRRGAEAVEAYKAMREYREMPALPEALAFLLACALAESGHREDAFRLFWEVAKEGPKGPQTETSLVRAGEIAASLPGHAQDARDCYRKLLEDYPYGPWRHIALKRLKDLETSAGSLLPDTGETGRASAVDDDLRYLSGPSDEGDGAV